MLVLVGCSSRPPADERGKQEQRWGEADKRAVDQVHQLEAAARRGEGSWTSTSGHDLIALANDGTVHSQPFPPPKHGAGDTVIDAWVAPDGSLFTAGYMITGVPGPDTGAIHRLKPGGALERIHEVPGHSLFGVWGRTSQDLFAIAKDLILHGDGSTWTELPLPEAGGMIGGVTGSASDVWVFVTSGSDESRIYRRTREGWALEKKLPCDLRTVRAVQRTVFASGRCDVVFRRDPDGTWHDEPLPDARPSRFDTYQLAALPSGVAYVAAGHLLARSPKGTWSLVDTTGFARVHGVWAAGDRVYALGRLVDKGRDSGVAVRTADAWVKVDLANCGVVTSVDTTTYCIRERRLAARPPRD